MLLQVFLLVQRTKLCVLRDTSLVAIWSRPFQTLLNSRVFYVQLNIKKKKVENNIIYQLLPIFVKFYDPLICGLSIQASNILILIQTAVLCLKNCHTEEMECENFYQNTVILEEIVVTGSSEAKLSLIYKLVHSTKSHDVHLLGEFCISIFFDIDNYSSFFRASRIVISSAGLNHHV